jgi:hypothetical protein
VCMGIVHAALDEYLQVLMDEPGGQGERGVRAACAELGAFGARKGGVSLCGYVCQGAWMPSTGRKSCGRGQCCGHGDDGD